MQFTKFRRIALLLGVGISLCAPPTLRAADDCNSITFGDIIDFLIDPLPWVFPGPFGSKPANDRPVWDSNDSGQSIHIGERELQWITPDPDNADALHTFECGAPSGLAPTPARNLASPILPSGQDASFIAPGDFNGDGITDYAILGFNDVTVTLYTAAGSPGSHVTYTTGSNIALLSADFNGDGKRDLAIVLDAGTSGQGYVAILLGHGDGTFGSPINYPAGPQPGRLAAGDFNADGKIDLAIANNAHDANFNPTPSIEILAGRGDGSFAAPVNLPLAQIPGSLLAVDVNGDGILDLVFVDLQQKSDKVWVMPGNGNGTFGQPVGTDVGSGGGNLSYADLNHDGKMDLLVADPSSNAFAVLLGNGDATFQTPVFYAATAQEPATSVAPLHLGDGSTALFILDYITGNLLNVIAASDGTIHLPRIQFVGSNPVGVAAASLSGNPRNDLLIADGGAPKLYVLSNQGQGQFGAPVSYTLGSAAAAVAAADLNGDGKPDAVVADASGLEVLLSQGNGTLGARKTSSSGTPLGALALADFNRDGKMDAAAVLSPGGVSVFPGNGDGTFRACIPVTLTAAGTPLSVATADFDGDGKPDLIASVSKQDLVTPGVLSTSLGKGDGTFNAPLNLTLPGFWYSTGAIATADLNRDGKVDVIVVVHTSNGNRLTVLLGNGNGTFQTPILTPTMNLGTGIAVADLNGDGIADLVLGDCCGLNEATYLLGNGDGTFAPEAPLLAGPSPVGIAAADLNGDGKTDLAVVGQRPYQQRGTLTLLGNAFPSTLQVTIQTNPTGLQFSVDGGALRTAPQTVNLTAGAHTIAVTPTQQGGAGTQYVFTSWSDNGTASHSITVGATTSTFTANFKTQYQLMTAALPASGGAVTPASGFFDANSSVPVSATANSGFQFTSWTGPVASTSSASTTVTMSAPLSVTANFSALSGITIQTSPQGLQFSVDGGTVQTAPQTLTLSTGPHTIAVMGTQQGGTGTQYVFTSWTDGGAASHMITVNETAATYTASFKTQYRLTTAASPTNGGTVTPATGFFDANTSVPVTATANSGFQFANWTGQVASSTSTSTTVMMSAPVSVTANFTPVSATGITIQTNPMGLQFSVDGGSAQTAPQTLNLPAGSHTIAVDSPQTGSPGTHYVFTNWSDGGAASHSIVVGSAAATITANFKTQYQLTISASPANGGSVSPPSGGFYDTGISVPITASAATGYQFNGWTGPVGSASSPSTSVTMSQPQTVTANFSIAGFTLSATSANIPAAGGSGTVSVTSTVPTAPWSAASNDNFITITSGPGGTGNGTVSYSVAANTSASTRQGTLTIAGQTFTVIQAGLTQSTALRFLPLAPCRVMDTRGANGNFGGPRMTAGSTRTVPIPQSGCNVPAGALAYSVNVTVVPPGPLTYLTIWPAGQTQPVVSTLNSFDGRVVANAAIVPAGTNGAVNVFVSNATDVILDINGVFVPAGTANSQSFYPVAPCRVMDTRDGSLPGAFGPPSLAGGSTRSFLIPASRCGISNTAQAYSLNVTVVPHTGLQYLTIWPAGQPQPNVSTLNSFDGSIVANAAIVPAGSQGLTNVFVTNDTDVIVDINGYFAPAGSPGAESLYTVTPCRVVDTRGGGGLSTSQSRSFSIPTGPCGGIPASAQAYSLNVTVVPSGPLGYLTAWPTGQPQPLVSTLNSSQGKVVANAALVPAGTNGAISIFVTNPTDLILDINAYFAP